MAGNSIIQLKEINRLALPAIVAGIAEPVITLVDTAFLGRIGTSELAGVGIASSFFLMVIWILAQTKSAVSAIVSRYFGQKDLQAILTFVPQAFYLNVALGFIVILVTWPLITPIFKLYLAKGEVLEYAKSYYMIRSIGYPITLGTFILFGIFRGVQNTLWAMQIALVGGAVNILGDAVLIFGLGPIPALGVEGAAWASVASQVTMLFLAGNALYRKTNFNLRFIFPWHKDIKWLFRMSWDFYVRTLSLNLAFFQTTRMSTALGETTMAAHTIALNIWLFSSFFIDGYANAANALSGRLLGERNFVALKKMVKDVARISVLIGFLLGMIYTLGYTVVPKAFTKDELVGQALMSIFWIIILMQPINAVAFAYDGVFKGLGEAKLLRNVLLISTFLVFFPFVLVTQYLDWKFYAVWAGMMIWMVSRAGFLAVLFQKWLKKRLTV
jgi:MATE family multidrug resistance protein